jgi:hypothetical protein
LRLPASGSLVDALVTPPRLLTGVSAAGRREVQTTMQPHEGPRRDRDAEERQRQRLLTWRLSLAILFLIGLLAAAMLYLW